MALKQWFGSETVVLNSSLPIDECVGRLRAAVVEKGVTGKIDENALSLRKALPDGVHNSFQTYLRAELETEGSMTRVTCRLGPHRFVVAFLVFWVCLALAIASAILWINLPALNAGDASSAISVAIPFMMMPMGVAVAVGGRRFARGERQFLLDFLRETIEARLITAATAARTVSVVQR